MIELKRDELVFRFPEVHRSASVRIDFQRTLRIPDDDRDYPLPPGLGRFPLAHVDDYAEQVPPAWIEHGGVMLPMYQAEAMWLNFTGTYDDERQTPYPFALKIATGKINAVSGTRWEGGLHRRPRQDYVVIPGQPWLDGYCVEKGVIRQFVAMPLCAGYTAEEQVTGEAEHGGLQVMAIPMKAEVFERRFPRTTGRRAVYSISESSITYCMEPSMGLAPGGRMKQEIEKDRFNAEDWDMEHSSRCFVHLCNSMVWRQITGSNPPTVPPTAKEYTDADMPWFDYYAEDSNPLKGAGPLTGLESVAAMDKKKGAVSLPENQPVTPQKIVHLRKGLKQGQVREFEEV